MTRLQNPPVHGRGNAILVLFFAESTGRFRRPTPAALSRRMSPRPVQTSDSYEIPLLRPRSAKALFRHGLADGESALWLDGAVYVPEGQSTNNLLIASKSSQSRNLGKRHRLRKHTDCMSAHQRCVIPSARRGGMIDFTGRASQMTKALLRLATMYVVTRRCGVPVLRGFEKLLKQLTNNHCSKLDASPFHVAKLSRRQLSTLGGRHPPDFSICVRGCLS